MSSDRGEFWRVALDDFDRHPLDGEGPGGFRADYLVHRHGAGVEPEDPHSIEMLMLSSSASRVRCCCLPSSWEPWWRSSPGGWVARRRLVAGALAFGSIGSPMRRWTGSGRTR